METEYQYSSERAVLNMLSDGQKSRNSKRFQPLSSWCTIRRIKMTFTGQVQKLNPVITTVFASLLVTASALTPNFWQVEELVSNIHLPLLILSRFTDHESYFYFSFICHVTHCPGDSENWALSERLTMEGADQFAQMRKLTRASFVNQNRNIISVYGLLESRFVFSVHMIRYSVLRIR